MSPACHLIHRPRAGGSRPASAPPGHGADRAERFSLAGDMPTPPPPFDDRPGRLYDPLAAVELIRQAAEFISRRFFGQPAGRPAICYRLDLAVTDVPAWRVGERVARLTASLTARPALELHRAPRGLALTATLRIDDRPCATVTARLLLQGTAARRGGPALAQLTEPAGEPGEPVAPYAVGGRDPAAVLVHDPSGAPGGPLSVRIAGPRWPWAADGAASQALLLEALRQTAVFAAHQAHALAPPRALLAGLRCRLPGFAVPRPPLRAAAVPGPLARDAGGRVLAPVALVVTRGGEPVAEAEVSVAQDAGRDRTGVRRGNKAWLEPRD
ncbi:AfsA-related hotdog domain-containing protein [Streptomyces litchfieldiae]|uniref:AfsA-related hotdog domain-containing protein n=1 Tax=Streptomyces litchfieldiae TaxID=3075543 RepID=A0ABU2MPA3_9ACTN|nr:AfsA-related hotdog domain-containing protein [Streptomyces sp. DSM 44938]MDT0343462.1 AfsA-related hotdog domain-containing protein [Streptomyces sp. DSM 44938]